ncbi:hypothetical protein C7H85_10195 [Zobellella endophytica]|uniref:DUF4136 domain-containing protein n=1 Tax=Zobellella endophytica TaxID=2116700 RepID=A0A2P7R6A3_9GAMM|nr:hypothetical protein [Zobellella endophytica]PSJ45738.1 hypothetical protein C7H85_10195 [Zobellella endophytica]
MFKPAMLLLAPALLLSGCAGLELPYYGGDTKRVSARTPGVAVTRESPPALSSVAFISDSRFDRVRARQCAGELLTPPAEKEDIIEYTGEDLLKARGEIALEEMQYAVLPTHYRIRFRLAALAHHNGITYGFNHLQLARESDWGLGGHDFQPLPPSGADADKVYRALQALYQELDSCIAG